MPPAWVALLAEGVDRNSDEDLQSKYHVDVALLAEGVDRNRVRSSSGVRKSSRPPRGGRG